MKKIDRERVILTLRDGTQCDGVKFELQNISWDIVLNKILNFQKLTDKDFADAAKELNNFAQKVRSEREQFKKEKK